jgi:hypothetical protein
MVQQHHAQKPRGNVVQRRVDLRQHAFAQRAMTGEQEAVVRPGRVDAHQRDLVGEHHVDAACAAHNAPAEIVAQAIVVSRNHCQALRRQQRCEDLVEEIELARSSAMSQVASDDHLIDVGLEERLT